MWQRANSLERTYISYNILSILYPFSCQNKTQVLLIWLRLKFIISFLAINCEDLWSYTNNNNKLGSHFKSQYNSASTYKLCIWIDSFSCFLSRCCSTSRCLPNLISTDPKLAWKQNGDTSREIGRDLHRAWRILKEKTSWIFKLRWVWILNGLNISSSWGFLTWHYEKYFLRTCYSFWKQAGKPLGQCSLQL